MPSLTVPRALGKGLKQLVEINVSQTNTTKNAILTKKTPKQNLTKTTFGVIFCGFLSFFLRSPNCCCCMCSEYCCCWTSCKERSNSCLWQQNRCVRHPTFQKTNGPLICEETKIPTSLKKSPDLLYFGEELFQWNGTIKYFPQNMGIMNHYDTIFTYEIREWLFKSEISKISEQLTAWLSEMQDLVPDRVFWHTNPCWTNEFLLIKCMCKKPCNHHLPELMTSGFDTGWGLVDKSKTLEIPMFFVVGLDVL